MQGGTLYVEEEEPPEEDDELEDELEVVEAQVDLVTVVWFNVTAPVISVVLAARSLPLTVELPLSVIVVKARIFPIKEVDVPRVAEDPTCQKTLQAWVPLVNLTTLFDAVVSVEPAWKMKTAFESPPPSSVRVPVIASELGSL